MARILIAGCGYVGSALGERLVGEYHEVWGLRRNPRSLPDGVEPIEADLAEPDALKVLPPQLDFVCYLASPGGAVDALYRRAYVEGLRALLEALEEQGQQPRRVLFASSTAVYHQHQGEWIDEAALADPPDFRGGRLLEAEQVLWSSPWPSTVVRFGGIYGPRRTRLIDRVRAGRAVYRDDPHHYSNRIHRDDCAGVLAHLMERDVAEALYLGADCDPADERTVMRWLAGALGAPEPRRANRSEAGAQSSRAEERSNKRCRNDRLVRSGYAFLYPTFREGYRAGLEEMV